MATRAMKNVKSQMQGTVAGDGLSEVSTRDTHFDEIVVIILSLCPVPSLASVGNIFLLFCHSLCSSPVLFGPACDQ